MNMASSILRLSEKHWKHLSRGWPYRQRSSPQFAELRKIPMRQIIFSIVIIVYSAAAAFAQQTGAATLSGRVADQAGAILVGVKVTATQKATGAKRKTVTSSEGLYVFTNLAPGEYELVFENTGFKKHIFQSYTIQVG